MDIAYYKSKYEPIDGKWFINKKLGSGAFGTVLEVERRDQTNMKAAIKIVSVPSNSGEVESYREENYELDEQSISSYFYGFVEEFTKEIQLMSEIKGHGNVVTIEDYDVKKHTDEIGWDIFIRMELLTPMNKYFRDNPPKTRDVIQLGIDICKALEVCQKYNIVHRDIKPSNIFVSKTGEYKLGDFGVARTLEKTSGALSKKGTYTYMAPEVYRGGEYGSNVDLYSLGIVMYKLLNGNKEPFKAGRTFEDEEKALVLRMKGETLPKPENAEGRLAEIILKACSYNPKERYESPLQMRSELESILNDEIVKPVPIIEEKLEEPTFLPENGYINGVYFKWDNAIMEASQITDFSISYGDCPIVNVKYSNNKLTVFNRINGSRDGWMTFPEGYFDEKIIEITEVENSELFNLIKSFNFLNWKSPDYALKNYIDMATGFCVHNSFGCSFVNGECFECIEPSDAEFKKLVKFLEKLLKKHQNQELSASNFEEDEKTIGIFEKHSDNNDRQPCEDNDSDKIIKLNGKNKKFLFWFGILAILSLLFFSFVFNGNFSKDKIIDDVVARIEVENDKGYVLVNNLDITEIHQGYDNSTKGHYISFKLSDYCMEKIRNYNLDNMGDAFNVFINEDDVATLTIEGCYNEIVLRGPDMYMTDDGWGVNGSFTKSDIKNIVKKLALKPDYERSYVEGYTYLDGLEDMPDWYIIGEVAVKDNQISFSRDDGLIMDEAGKVCPTTITLKEFDEAGIRKSHIGFIIFDTSELAKKYCIELHEYTDGKNSFGYERNEVEFFCYDNVIIEIYTPKYHERISQIYDDPITMQETIEYYEANQWPINYLD